MGWEKRNRIRFGLEKDMISGNEILEISSTGSFNLSLQSIASKIIKGISNPKFLLDLNYLRIKMNNINKHYKNFPTNIEKFEAWKNKTMEIYNQIDNNKMTYG